MTRVAQGLKAEKQVVHFLQKRGYHCLAQRFKTPYGEIDLVMEHKDGLVFTEVKKRSSLSKGLHALMPRQCQRILNAARLFLQNYPEKTWDTIQFDLVVVWGDDHVYHIPHVITQSM